MVAAIMVPDEEAANAAPPDEVRCRKAASTSDEESAHESAHMLPSACVAKRPNDSVDVYVEGRTVADVVADLGWGPGQLFVMMLSSGGVYFSNGMVLTLTSIVAQVTAREFDLSPHQRATLSMVTLSGVMVGTLLSGYFGDIWGRRAPTMWSLLGTALCGLLCSTMPTYVHILLGRILLGIVMGFGIPPSTVFASEITPEPWRIVMKTFSSICFSVGGVFVTLLAAFDDPTYQNLQWRRLMALAAIPPAVFWALGCLLLSESPIFLATSGRHAEARAAFVRLKALNSCPDLNIYYTPPEEMNPQEDDDLTFRASIRTVFSRKYRYLTLSLIYCCFCVNLVSYGDSYAGPQVLSETLSETSEMAPAWMLVIKNCLAVIMCMAGGFVGSVLPRKWCIGMCLFALMMVTLSFAYAGMRLGDKSPITMFFYHIGAHGSVVGCATGYITLFQVSVEIYPTRAAATGGAIVIGGGRIAAIIAPMLFEHIRAVTGQWTYFYIVMAAFCFVALIVVYYMDAPKPYRPGTPGTPKAADMGTYGTTTSTPGPTPRPTPRAMPRLDLPRYGVAPGRG